MKVLLTTLLLLAAMLFSAERLNNDPDRKLRIIMTDIEGMPLEDGFYNVKFMIYDKNKDGILIDEKSDYVESKNGVCRLSELVTAELEAKGYKDIWISLKIENQPETTFRTRIFLDPYK